MKEAVKVTLEKWKHSLRTLKEIRKTFPKKESYRDRFVAIDNQIMITKMVINDLAELKKVK